MNQGQIENLEDYLESMGIEDANQIVPDEKNKARQEKKESKDKKILSTRTKKQDKDPNGLSARVSPNSVAALSKDANAVLKSYIARHPKVKVVKQQIEVLKEMAIEYKKVGKSEYYDECKSKIFALNNIQKNFEKIVKSKTEEEKTKENENIKKSEKLKNLKTESEELKAEYRAVNPASLQTELSKLRERLALNGDTDITDIEEEPEELEITNLEDDLDTANPNAKVSLKDRYNDLMLFFSDKTGISTDTLKEMTTSKIIKAYKENLTDEDKAYINQIKTKIENNKLETSSEIKRIKGYNDITDVIYNMFDMTDDNSEQPSKEMLAASNVKYVEAVAYNICSKINSLPYYEDAVAYGLVGLSVAINKWYSIQKMKDHAVSFEGFAYIYIANSIRRGLYQLKSGGMMTGSVAATIEHYRNERIANWLSDNPEFKDLSPEIINSMIDNTFGESDVKSVTTESDYRSAVSNDDEDSADVWANATSDKAANFAEVKLEYETLIKSLKQLFSLFETRENKETGVRQITNKKLFDKYDYALFLMEFGLKTKQNGEPYNQTEIAREMTKLYAENGIKKSLTQPAISARVKSIMNRINQAMEAYPSLKKGFEYLMYYFAANRETVKLISSSRNELGYSFQMNENPTNTPKIKSANLGKSLTESYNDSDFDLNYDESFEEMDLYSQA